MPTATEAGFPELRYEAFLGFFGPRGMSSELRERISADLRLLGTDEEMARKFNAMGMRLRVTSPAELETVVSDERAALVRLQQARH